MLNNTIRHGNFTSSGIVALTSKNKKGDDFGKPALTYIAEKNMERRHGCSLETETIARPTTWGKLLEQMVNKRLGLEYAFTSEVTYAHPEISCWVGSPDVETIELIGDVKCPLTRKSFSLLVDPLYEGFTGMAAMNKVREMHPDGETYYWQLVSNSIIRNKKQQELIVFMPYESELDEVRMLSDGMPNCYWIANALPGELPYLKDGGYYKNLNKIRFEAPEEDRIFITECILKASEYLTPPFAIGPASTPIIASYDTEVKATIIQ